MASIFKRDGERNYTIAYRDAKGRRREMKGTADKKTTSLIAAKLVNETALRKRGIIDPAADRLAEAAEQTLDEHLADFESYLQSKGGTEKHVACTLGYVRRVCAASGVVSIATLSADRLASHINVLRRQGVTAGGINCKLVAVKSFARWLCRTGRLTTDPLGQITRLNTKVDRKFRRRAISNDEAARLIHAAENGPSTEGIDGPDRGLLYRTALGTGFRAAELMSLTPGSFDLDADPPTVTIEAGYSKHRRRDVQPIRPDLADRLRPWLATRPAGRPVFTVGDRTAEMLRADLAAAKTAWLKESATAEECYARWGSDFLAAQDSAGRVVDFHALRATFITWLARAGVAPAVAKSLARHSTIVLTVDHYTHTIVGDDSAALAKLPELEVEAVTEAVELRATGSDGRAQITGEIGPQERPQIRPQMDAKSNQRPSTPATIGMVHAAHPGQVASGQKRLENRRLSIADHRPATPTAEENDGGPCWTRTSDQRIMSPQL